MRRSPRDLRAQCTWLCLSLSPSTTRHLLRLLPHTALRLHPTEAAAADSDTVVAVDSDTAEAVDSDTAEAAVES